MDSTDASALSLMRGYDNLIDSVLGNIHPMPSCKCNQSVEAETLSNVDGNLFEIAIVGAGCLLVPDMTYHELSQLMHQFG